MTNTEFWRSISAIISNGFDKDGIIKLEDYAEQFFNKQLLFKRYSPSEQHGCATGGSFHVVASILAGAETPTNQLTAPEGSFKRDCQRAEAQAAVIERLKLQAVGLMMLTRILNKHSVNNLPKVEKRMCMTMGIQLSNE